MPRFVYALASLILPGLGQIFLGQFAKGALLILLSVIGIGAFLSNAGFSLLGIGLFNVVIGTDAYLLAKRNRVKPWQWFG